jgi:hypothetical protein
MMRAETPAAFDMAVRWIHVHAWVLIRSFVGFVRLYLRAGRFVAGLGSLRLAEGLLKQGDLTQIQSPSAVPSVCENVIAVQ